MDLKKYMRHYNKNTGVKEITIEFLNSLNLKNVPKIIYKGFYNKQQISINSNYELFVYDNFTPRVNSIFFKPSFAGRQVLIGMGITESNEEYLLFSNGRWFSNGKAPKELIEKLIRKEAE